MFQIGQLRRHKLGQLILITLVLYVLKKRLLQFLTLLADVGS